VKTWEAKLNGLWLILITLVSLETWVELEITRFRFGLSFKVFANSNPCKLGAWINMYTY
jgi:hypothetical protein